MKKQIPAILSFQFRIAVILFFTIMVYSVIAIQLWNVQVNESSAYLEQMSRQSARKIRIPPIRGEIRAAGGEVIVGNRASYDVLFHLSEMRLARRDRTLDQVLSEADRVANCIGRENPNKKQNISLHMNNFPGIPMTMFKDLTKEEMGKLIELAPAVNGMEIVAEPVRNYPYGMLAAHVAGYVGVSDPKKADDRAEFFYYIPDMVGKTGIEKLYDDKLRGVAGKKLVLVNSRGFVHKQLEAPTPAQDGHSIVLTMDLKAQQIAERLIADSPAAMIVQEAETGAIVAMASAPGYSPADFYPRITTAKYRELIQHPGRPFINKCTMGTFMPGSIIKPVAALAFLNNGLTIHDTVVCDGATHFGRVAIRCAAWRSGGHGELNVEQAIQKSCNDFFMENGVKLGIEKLSQMYASAGIGEKTGFELGEQKGVLPAGGRRWTPCDTGLVSIGQGKITVTPLQAISYASAIANGGTLWTPYIVDRILDSDGNSVFVNAPEIRRKLNASPESIATVQHGMEMAVNEPGGSAKNARNQKIHLFGKTGTAEVGPRTNRTKVTWFIGFGRQKGGKLYTVIVMVENGSSGGGTSAPLARQFFEEWLPEPPSADKEDPE